MYEDYAAVAAGGMLLIVDEPQMDHRQYRWTWRWSVYYRESLAMQHELLATGRDLTGPGHGEPHAGEMLQTLAAFLGAAAETYAAVMDYDQIAEHTGDTPMFNRATTEAAYMVDSELGLVAEHLDGGERWWDWASVYEAHDAALNQMYPPVVIAGSTIDPSRILRRCDPGSYRQHLTDWLDAMAINESTLVGDEPTP